MASDRPDGRPDRRVTVLDGKYTFCKWEGDYRIHVLRYGEPWLAMEQGHNAVAALMSRVEELETAARPVLQHLQTAIVILDEEGIADDYESVDVASVAAKLADVLE